MQEFAIIGYPLIHSFSARYFNEKFEREQMDAHYELYPLQQIDEFVALCAKHHFTGMNVTMPYKEVVIPYLTQLDRTAREIGAVNVIRFDYAEDGTMRTTGYNTDCLGFIRSMRKLLRGIERKAIVLGTGGASKAACYGLRELGIEPTLVSRDPAKGLTYAALQGHLDEYDIIVNATPLGMVPNIDACPDIPYDEINRHHICFDCIYNPEETLFLRKAKAQGATTQFGYEMLIGQAEAAWEIWGK